MAEEKEINIFKNRLVPKCRILKDEEVNELLKKYNISKQQLPRILVSDPMAKAMDAKIGDVLEIERVSKTAGLSKFYRVVSVG